MQHTTPPMEGSFALPLHNGSNVGAVKQMKDPSAASGKSVVVLKGSDVRIRHGKVFMPNTIEMAQLKKPEKGQFKTNVQFSSTMTEMDVRKLLEGIFPFLRNQRLYCAAAVDNRTRLHFHGQPRVWTGYFLRQKIKGNSALYVVTDEGEIEALQVAQNSSSSDTGFFDQEVDYISSSAFSEAAEPESSCVPHVAPEHMTLFGVVDDIHPKSGSLEGGYKCQINLTEPLESNVTSGTAQFKGVDDNVPWQKLNPFTLVLSVPPSTKAGNVDVEVFDQTGKRLGMTVFCYRDFQWEMVKQMISNKNLSSLFSILAQKFESSQLGGGDNAAQGIGPLNMQDQGQTQQQQSLQLLQLLVYTAAETDAQEFIKVIFSTSAGPIVFNSYKDKTPLPEDVARANGHRYLTQYLQDVHTRLSKKVGIEAQSDAIDWLELVKAVQTQASAQDKSIKEEKHPSKSDDNLSDYFADSETSSRGSSDLDDSNRSDSDSDSPIEDEKLFRPTQSLSSVDRNDFIGLKKEFEVRGSRVPCGSGERFTIHDGCGKWSHIMDVENGPMLKDQQVIDGNSSKDDDQEMITMSSEAFSIMSEAKDDDATKQYLTAWIKRTPVCLLTGVPGLGKRSSLVKHHLGEPFRDTVRSPTFTVFESKLRDLHKNVVNFKDKDPETGLPTMAQKKQAILWGSYLVLPVGETCSGKRRKEELPPYCLVGATSNEWVEGFRRGGGDLFGVDSMDKDPKTGLSTQGQKQEVIQWDACGSDLVEGVGPELAETFSMFARLCKKVSNVRDVTSDIFSEFADVQQAFEERKTFSALVLGHGRSKDLQLKVYDIAAKAIAELKDNSKPFKAFQFTFVNVPIGQQEKIADMFLQQGVDHSPLVVRSFKEREQLAAEFCKVDLAIMPSRSDGFGCAALEALSAGLPVLVNGNSGIGEALRNVPCGSNYVLGDSDNPKAISSIHNSVLRFFNVPFELISDVQRMRDLLSERILTDGEKKFEEVGSHITCGYGKTGCGRWHMAYDLFWNPQYIDGNSSEEDDLETSNVEIETQESPKLSCYDAGYQEGVDIDCQEDEKLFGPTPSLSSVDRNPFFVLKKEFKESYGIAFVNALADKSSKEDGQETSNAFSVLTEAKHDDTKIPQINTGESKLVNSVSIRQEEKVADPFLQLIIDLSQPFEGSPARCCERPLVFVELTTEIIGFAVRFPFLVHVTPGQGEDANCIVGNTGSGKSSLNKYPPGLRFLDSVCSPAFTVCELKCREMLKNQEKDNDPETGLRVALIVVCQATRSLSLVERNDFFGPQKEFEEWGSYVTCGSGRRFTIHDGCGKWSLINPLLRDQQVIDGNSSKEDDQETSNAFSIMSEAKDDDATKQISALIHKLTPVCLLTGIRQ